MDTSFTARSPSFSEGKQGCRMRLDYYFNETGIASIAV